MPNKQAQKQPKDLIQGRVTPKLHTDYLKWGELHHIKKKTQILEHLLNAFFLEQSTSKPLEQTPSKVSIPQGCQSCDLKGVWLEIEGKLMMMCILREKDKPPKILYHSPDEAKICSQKPIYISKATQERYESRIETLSIQLERAEENEDILQRKDDYYKELRKTLIQKDQDIKGFDTYTKTLEKQLRQANSQIKPMQDLLTERDRLKCRLSGVENEMKNGLLERDEKIAILQTDNEQLRKTVEELSHDTLIEINKDVTHQLEEAKQLLKVQQAQADNSTNDYKTEIRKLEAFIEKRNQIFNDALSQVKEFLRDAKRFAPQSPQSYDQDFIQFSIALRKSIENLEGYLNRISI